MTEIDLADQVLKAKVERDAKGGAVTLDDFVAYVPTHSYVYIPTRERWYARGLDARLKWPVVDGKLIKPSSWLDQHRPVEGMAWAPGEALMISDKLIVKEGGWIPRPGCTTFNLYAPPTVTYGDPSKAGPWVNHVSNIYETAADHIISFLAHRVQRPGEKINHALVLGGSQGIGKDTILEPVKYAVGAWNFQEVSPVQILGRFNGFVKSVILRVSEARDLGDVDRYMLYEHMKVLLAAPPDVLRCDEKNLREHPVVNVCGVVLTTNHKSDGLYLPPDDRRHYVSWSDRKKEDFSPEYWRDLWDWYGDGGRGHVAAYLSTIDISDFNAKSPPPKTEAWHEMVNSSCPPEAGELVDVLDSCGWPAAVTLDQLAATARDIKCAEFIEFLADRRNRRKIPHRLEVTGYVQVRNTDDKHDGQWRINGRRQTAYARQQLSLRERLAAVRALASRT